MASSDTLLPPITQGGFTNSGSDIINRKVTHIDAPNPSTVGASLAGNTNVTDITASASLKASNMTLDEYYDIPQIVSFVCQHSITKLALQFPDELIADAPSVAASIRRAFAEHLGLSTIPTGNVNLRDVVTVAPKNGNDDTPSTPSSQPSDIQKSLSCPNLYILGDTTHGACCVDEIAAQHTNCDGLIHFGFACLTPNVRIPTLFVFGKHKIDHNRIAKDIIETIRGRNEEGQPRNYIVLYDRHLYSQIPLIASTMQQITTTSNGENKVDNDWQDSIQVLNSTVVIPKCVTTNEDWRKRGTNDFSSVGDQSVQIGTQPYLEFAGYTWKAPQPETSSAEPNTGTSPDDVAVDEDDTDVADDDDSKPGPTNVLWHQHLNQDMWDIIVVGIGRSEVISQAGGSELAHSSNVLISHITMNFQSHRLHVFRASSTPDLSTIIAPNNSMYSRLLGKRFYAIERAKNASIFGIVVCTLTTSNAVAAIRRLQTLIKANQKKSYLLSIGKVNEPKLLNFPDIEVFILIGCPFSALSDTSTTQSATLVTAVEAEFALDPMRTWNGQYSTDFRDMFSQTGRLGLVLQESSVDDGRNDDHDMTTENKRQGGDKDDGNGGDCEPEDNDAPRYSTIDGKLHHRVSRQEIARALLGENNIPSSSDHGGRLVATEIGTMVESTSKPFYREFTGLDASLNLTEENMKIQPGLHGTSRGYIQYGQDSSPSST